MHRYNMVVLIYGAFFVALAPCSTYHFMLEFVLLHLRTYAVLEFFFSNERSQLRRQNKKWRIEDHRLKINSNSLLKRICVLLISIFNKQSCILQKHRKQANMVPVKRNAHNFGNIEPMRTAWMFWLQVLIHYSVCTKNGPIGILVVFVNPQTQYSKLVQAVLIHGEAIISPALG